MSPLLGLWPAVLKKKNDIGVTPLDIAYQYDNLVSELQIVRHLLCIKPDKELIYNAVRKFARMGWWIGMGIILDGWPTAHPVLSISSAAMPNVLEFAGGRCGVLTVWEILRNRQDTLSEIECN
mmetsp:Transcript_5202/g.7133  ORF Transcript_5202/g.7133 Transcript_5202/m.7133 type:complete len:123 (-) Transcript_5202:390-758(-)